MTAEFTRVPIVNEVMGQIIRDARKEKGMSQYEAATRLRISQSRLSTYERGGAMPFERIVKACRLYGLDIRWVAKTIEAVTE